MKKLHKLLAAVVVSAGLLTAPVSAEQAGCDGLIEVTGPGSNNVIDCVTDEEVNITCVDNVFVGNVNVQIGESGGAEGSNNTVVGNVATGTVVNHNGTDIEIGRSGCGGQQPGGGGQPGGGQPSGGGGGQAAPVAPAAAKPVEALPFTAASSPLETAAVVAVALGAAALVARVAISAYRRLALK